MWYKMSKYQNILSEYLENIHTLPNYTDVDQEEFEKCISSIPQIDEYNSSASSSISGDDDYEWGTVISSSSQIGSSFHMEKVTKVNCKSSSRVKITTSPRSVSDKIHNNSISLVMKESVNQVHRIDSKQSKSVMDTLLEEDDLYKM